MSTQVFEDKYNVKVNTLTPKYMAKQVNELPNFFNDGEVFEMDGTLYKGNVINISNATGGYYRKKIRGLIFNKESLLRVMEITKENNPNVTDDSYDYSYIAIEDKDENYIYINVYVNRIIVEKYNEDTDSYEELEIIYKEGKWYKDKLIFNEEMIIDELYNCMEEMSNLSYGTAYNLERQITETDFNIYNDERPRLTQNIYDKMRMESKAFFNNNNHRIELHYLYYQTNIEKLYECEGKYGAFTLPNFDFISNGYEQIELNFAFQHSIINNELLNIIFENLKNCGYRIIDLENAFKSSTLDEFDLSGFNMTPFNINNSFAYCLQLTKIKGLDLSAITGWGLLKDAFIDCEKLTELELFNIKANIQIGSGTRWGHLLTKESLIHTIKELVDVGESRTLTMGSTNLAKLENVYVRVLDYGSDDKYKFELCESTDADAMSIFDYASNVKGWTLA